MPGSSGTSMSKCPMRLDKGHSENIAYPSASPGQATGGATPPPAARPPHAGPPWPSLPASSKRWRWPTTAPKPVTVRSISSLSPLEVSSSFLPAIFLQNLAAPPSPLRAWLPRSSLWLMDPAPYGTDLPSHGRSGAMRSGVLFAGANGGAVGRYRRRRRQTSSQRRGPPSGVLQMLLRGAVRWRAGMAWLPFVKSWWRPRASWWASCQSHRSSPDPCHLLCSQGKARRRARREEREGRRSQQGRGEGLARPWFFL
ncbi:hypothetical protein SETIT_3G157300v2 [Setaria italica]|uniref:Uncharacterized protein n=2 Tax=Setaria TaxID=4554 RepID=A0A368QHD3_SETIT|nr:hypothetical protein SETIT_3G157300v2 [Setaria italica]TKW26047.1 hypothetical protein SEVIR_3G160400v2 [Setaria viridis]